MRVAILGGGLAGVAAAHELSKRGQDFAVFEATESIGGLCRSAEYDGFVFDIGGVHAVHSRDSEMLAFMLSILAKNVERSERRAAILQNGHKWRFPLASHLSDLPVGGQFAAVAGLLRSRVLRRIGTNASPTLAEWFVSNFGEYLAKEHYYPYAEKLWKTDLDDLAFAWLSEIIPRPRIRSVLGRLTAETRSYIYHPQRGGIAALVGALGSSVASRIRLGTPVVRVEKHGRRFAVNGDMFDAVISTLPIPVLAACCQGMDSRLLAGATRLAFLSLATFCIATREPPRFAESWLYIPAKTASPVHRVSCMNNLGALNKNADDTSLIAEVSFRSEYAPEISEAYTQAVVNSLERLGVVDAAQILFTKNHFFKYAYVVGDHYARNQRDAIVQAVHRYGICSLGRFAEFRQMNMDRTISGARWLADSLCARA